MVFQIRVELIKNGYIGRRRFENFISGVGITDVAQKLQMLTNSVSPTIYEFIADATVFDNAMSTCGKDGHFAKVCMSKPTSASLVTSSSPTFASLYPTLATCATAPNNLKRAVISIELNNNTTEALIDTGSPESFICKNIVHELKLTVNPFKSKVSMAESSLSVDIIGYVIINNMKMRGNNYANVKLLVLKNLC